MFLKTQDFMRTGAVRKVRLFAYSRERDAGDWKSYEHKHAYAEIFYILSGAGVFHTAQKDYSLKRGTLVINNPNVPHAEYSDEARPLEYAVFSIDNATFAAPTDETENVALLSEENDEAAMKNETTFLKSFVFYDLPSDEIERAVEETEREIEQKRPLWEEACGNIFERLLIFVMRETRLSATKHDPAEKTALTAYAKEYLEAHYYEDLSLERLAGVFFVNKHYLAHAFSRDFGFPPMRYLAEVRCKAARKLLLRGSYTVAAIALSVGYPSVSYFSSVYKKHYGETPQETRKRGKTQR